jgi:vancomycin resistance protein VanJ
VKGTTWKILRAILTFVAILGFLLRLTVRDRFAGLALVNYATPWPVLAVLFGILSWKSSKRCHRAGWLVAVAAAIGLWFTRSWRWTPISLEPAALRVALWNVARPVSRFSTVVQRLRAEDPDLIAIAEALPRGDESTKRWQRAFPEYRAEYFRGNMLLLVRGEIMEREAGELSRGSFYGAVRARVKGRLLTVIQVDFAAAPGRDRGLPFGPLRGLLEQSLSEAMLVLGDFNTPRDSVHFDPLRAHWHQAFEASGHGYAETWPMPVPMLALDQIWTRLRPLRCRHGVSAYSDHRPVFADLAWE